MGQACMQLRHTSQVKVKIIQYMGPNSQVAGTQVSDDLIVVALPSSPTLTLRPHTCGGGSNKVPGAAHLHGKHPAHGASQN